MQTAEPPEQTSGERLRAWREEAGKTQTECAKVVGVSQGAWADWEADRRQPQVSIAFAIEDLTKGAVPARVFAKPRSVSSDPEAA